MVRDNTIYHTTDTTLQQLVLKNQDLQLKTLIKQIETYEVTKRQTTEVQGGNLAEDIYSTDIYTSVYGRTEGHY